MTDLSPAAQVILDQFVIGACGKTYDIHAGLAAALRAAADQAEQKLRGFSRETCQEIRSIAAELETSTTENR